jgi:hypothetical protein
MPTRAVLVLLGFWVAAAAPGTASPVPQDVATNDRLSLTIADDGSVSKLRVDAKDVPLLAAGGFFLQDMSRKSVPQDIPNQQRAWPGIPLRGGSVDRVDGALRHRVESAAAGVSFEARYLVGDGHLEIQTRLKNLSADERAFVLYFRLPVDAVGWSWARALGDEREIKEGERCYEPHWFFRGSRPSVSHSHIGCISGKDAGLSLAMRADDPRLFRIVYEKPYGFSIEFDLGLTPRTLKFPNEATARFVLYRHDPRWGMRSAQDRYLRFFPQWYARTPKAPDGLWVTAIPKDLADPEDFGITYFETYDWSRPYSRQHGILHMKYTEPWCDHIHGDWGAIKGRGDPASKGHPHSIAKGQPDFVQSRAALASAVLDRDGKPQAFWCKQRGGDDGTSDGEGYGPDLNRYITNPSLDVPVPGDKPEAGKLPAEDWLAGNAGATAEPMSRLYRKEPGVAWHNRGQSVYGWELYKQWGREPDLSKADNRYEGLYYDSTANFWSGWHLYNFNPDHVAVANLPPGFDHQTRRPALHHGFSCLEFMRECSKKMFDEGRVTMANTGPSFDTFYVAPHLSMLGAGEAFDAPGGDLTPLRRLRLAVGSKPLSYLYTNNLDERIFEQCLLYAVFPGGFKPEKRALFKKYVPALKALGAAGWQPIPYVRADREGVDVERFGAGEALHLAVHSLEKGGPSGTVTLTVDADALGPAPAGGFIARDLVNGETIALTAAGSAWTFPVALRSAQTRAFSVKRG